MKAWRGSFDHCSCLQTSQKGENFHSWQDRGEKQTSKKDQKSHNNPLQAAVFTNW